MHITGHEFYVHNWESLQATASTSARAEVPQLEIKGTPKSGLHHLSVYNAMTIFNGSNTQLAVSYTTRLGQNTGRGT